MNMSAGPGPGNSPAKGEFIGKPSGDFTDLFKQGGSKKTYEAHAMQMGMLVALGAGFLLKALLSK